MPPSVTSALMSAAYHAREELPTASSPPQIRSPAPPTVPLIIETLFGALSTMWMVRYLYPKALRRTRVKRQSPHPKRGRHQRPRGPDRLDSLAVEKSKPLPLDSTIDLDSHRNHLEHKPLPILPDHHNDLNARGRRKSRDIASSSLFDSQHTIAPPPLATIKGHHRGPSMGAASYLSAQATPASTVVFASPATTLLSVRTTPKTKERAFGPGWFYSPRKKGADRAPTHLVPPSHSAESQEIRAGLVTATWGGAHLATLLEAEPSKDNPARAWPRDLV